jgi:hypothetical protein
MPIFRPPERLKMRDVRSYRALGSLCRQRAVFDPDNSWKWLSEAERWEHLADAEIDARYQECNSPKRRPEI